MTVPGDTVARPRALDGASLGIAPTTFLPPRSRAGIVPREDLVKRLLDTQTALVTITAPAGYGKSTTLALWDAADERDFAWVHLDASDDDPVHLLQHVALALDAVVPVGDHAARVLTGPGRSVDLDLVPTVGLVLHAGPPVVVVLEDVHHLSSQGSLGAISGLLAQVPPGSQLVLAGRSVPDIPTAKRRMSGELTEITATELALSDHDAERLLAEQGAAVSPDDVARLVEQTEGWAGGLHLAALALTRPDGTRSALDFSGRDRLVADYLVEEVLHGLPDEFVEFLCCSSVLSRMSASLLDELLDTDTSGRRLAQVEATGNLFLVPLDHERVWYRYHHLFADLLRARLRAEDPGRVRALHARASRLLEARDDMDGAVRHAVEAGEHGRAADLVLVHGQVLAFAGRVHQLRQWLDLLPAEAGTRWPAAALAWAWYGAAVGDAEVLERSIATAAADPSGVPLADGSPSAATAAAMVRALTAPDGIHGVVRDTEVVRTAGDPPANALWGRATVVQATALSMRGEHQRAHELFRAGLATPLSPAYEAASHAHLAYLDLEVDDLPAAEDHARRARQLAEQHNLDLVLPAIAVFPVDALVSARCGRIDDADRAATLTERLLARLGDLSSRSAVFGYTVLAQAALAAGDRARSRTLVSEANRARRREPDARFLNEKLDELSRELESGSHEPTLAAAPLTAAELRVLAYLPTHLSLQEIADQLIISRNTAKSHSVAIYRKLGVASRSDAVAEARRLGLLDS